MDVPDGTGGAMRTTERLTEAERAEYDEQGFLRLAGFADADLCARMLDRVVAITHAHAGGERAPGFVLAEANLAGRAGNPEDVASKVFRLHRDTVFAEFAHSRPLTELLADLVGPDIDCFLSQFIFKNPGAWGQPWHQDSYYFPFDPPRPITGVWLAVSEATLENGCLHVLPGSHREPVHDHEPDRRPNANYGYVEIVDHDMSDAVPVLMQPGDLLLFDSHLMHRSTDNESAGVRAAMVYHYASAGTVDRRDSPINDFVPVRRA
jgi:ectoine hydroxylase-related dioxygenase (phytanoyl-CoA dioxygenase family)